LWYSNGLGVVQGNVQFGSSHVTICWSRIISNDGSSSSAMRRLLACQGWSDGAVS
jgi:hypothetical protein